MSHVETSDKSCELLTLVKDIGLGICLGEAIHVPIDSYDEVEIVRKVWYLMPQIVYYTAVK